MIQKTLKRKTQRSQMMSSTGKQFFQKLVGIISLWKCFRFIDNINLAGESWLKNQIILGSKGSNN